MRYIWQHFNWPNFNWQSDQLLDALSKARLNQGKLLSKVSAEQYSYDSTNTNTSTTHQESIGRGFKKGSVSTKSQLITSCQRAFIREYGRKR